MVRVPPFVHLNTPPNDNDVVILNNDSPFSDFSVSGDVGNIYPPFGLGNSSPVGHSSLRNNADQASTNSMPTNRCPLYNTVENGGVEASLPDSWAALLH